MLVGSRHEELVSEGDIQDGWEKLNRLLEDKKIPIYERVLKRKDGSEFPVGVNLSMITDSLGNPSRVQSIVRDISERKQAEQAISESEQRFRALFEQTNDAVYIMDLEGITIAANQKAATLLGYASPEMLIGMPNDEQVPDSEILDGREKFNQLLEGKKISIYERIIKRRDGSEITVEINLSLITDSA